MNKLLAILLLGLSTTVMAQKSKIDAEQENTFRFGAKAGVNMNKISGKSYTDGFNYNFQIGGFIQYNFSDRFGIQPEINFVQSSSETTDDANDIYDDVFYGGSQNKQKFNYLEIPVLLNINVGESKRVKLQLGPAYSNLMNEPVDKEGVYKKAEWSAIGGLWLQLPLVNLGARYKIGLTNINDIDNQDEWKNQAIQVFIGVTF